MPDMHVTLLGDTIAALPPEGWWLAALVFAALGVAAAIDAFTARVPDVLIFVGLAVVAGAQAHYVSGSFAAANMGMALAVGVTIWGVNELWYKKFGHDALGMGDAKWSMLAVSCFGLALVALAWGAGACLALLWMAGGRLIRRRVRRVHFAPFLFTGLLIGLWHARPVSF